MSDKFKIGDRVKVIDHWLTYPGCADLANELGATLWESGRSQLKNGDVVNIINIKSEAKIALVQKGQEQYLIDFNGLKMSSTSLPLLKKGDKFIYTKQMHAAEVALGCSSKPTMEIYLEKINKIFIVDSTNDSMHGPAYFCKPEGAFYASAIDPYLNLLQDGAIPQPGQSIIFDNGWSITFANVDMSQMINKKSIFNSLTQKVMDLRTKFGQLLKSPKQKKFMKAGIINQCDELTQEGKDIGLTFLLMNSPEFEAEVDTMLAETESEKKSK